MQGIGTPSISLFNGKLYTTALDQSIMIVQATARRDTSAGKRCWQLKQITCCKCSSYIAEQAVQNRSM